MEDDGLLVGLNFLNVLFSGMINLSLKYNIPSFSANSYDEGLPFSIISLIDLQYESSSCKILT